MKLKQLVIKLKQWLMKWTMITDSQTCLNLVASNTRFVIPLEKKSSSVLKFSLGKQLSCHKTQIVIRLNDGKMRDHWSFPYPNIRKNPISSADEIAFLYDWKLRSFPNISVVFAVHKSLSETWTSKQKCLEISENFSVGQTTIVTLSKSST